MIKFKCSCGNEIALYTDYNLPRYIKCWKCRKKIEIPKEKRKLKINEHIIQSEN